MKAGFTLIELAIALIIAGLLISASLPLVNLWMLYKRQSVTEEHIQDIREAMEQYIFRQGVYPCPGPRINMEADYPFAENCMLHDPKDISDAQARGVYFVRTDAGKAVIEGGVPYQRLNIPKSAMFDGWGNLFTYAVTADATNTAGDNPGSDGGGIAITNSHGKSVIEPPASALWVLISHGQDGSGSYTGDSNVPHPCDKNHLDAKNCGHTGSYVMDDKSLAEGNQYFDDIVFYRTWIEFPERRYPGYCRIDSGERNVASHAGTQVQDGVFVKVCASNTPSLVDLSKCQWFICRNGVLVPGVADFTGAH